MRRACLWRHEGGVSAVEFGLISPVLMALLFGMFDLGHTLYATSMINGAMQEVARSSTIEGATTADLDAEVTRAVERVLPTATITFSRKSYSDFADVSRPEDYDDLNGSDTCDNGETFEDVNGNGVWDADRGAAGNGGAREAVLYKVTATYDRIFPVPEFLGFAQSTSITGQTVLRNQPYQRMASTPVTTPHVPGMMRARLPLLRRLRANCSGVAMTEFALSLPLLIGAGMFAAETAWLTLAHMKVSQTALQLADNASRIGDTSNLASRKIYESDMADILFGAAVLAESLDLYPNGRVVVSSLEVFDEGTHCDVSGTTCASATADDGDQFIHWQRCMGARNVTPRYGEEGDILPDGMGPVGEEVAAGQGLPVIFVEVTYLYQPLFGNWFFTNEVIFETASFVVRDDRDLTQVYQRSVSDPDQVWSCDRFETDPLAPAA